MRLCALVLLAALGLLCGADPVLVIRADQRSFTDAARGIGEELGSRVHIVDQPVDAHAEFDYQQLKERIRTVHPRILVVMDNPFILMARQLAAETDPVFRNLPVVAAMGINLKKELKGSRTMCGVGYEVAPFSIITGLQQISTVDIRRVLIVYRRSVFADYVADATRQLERAGITVLARDAEENGTTPDDVQRFLDRNLTDLARDHAIDAVVVMGDNGLVSKRTMPIWQRASEKAAKPFLSGLDVLTGPRADLCTFAAFPDPAGIGIQVGQMIGQILDGDATPEQLGVEYPLATIRKLDLHKARRLDLPLRDDRLANVIRE